MPTLFDQPPASPSDPREDDIDEKISEHRRYLNKARKNLKQRKRTIMSRYAKQKERPLFSEKSTGPDSKHAVADLFGGPDLSRNGVDKALRNDPKIKRFRRAIRGAQHQIIRLEALRDRILGTEDPQQTIQFPVSFHQDEVQEVTP